MFLDHLRPKGPKKLNDSWVERTSEALRCTQVIVRLDDADAASAPEFDFSTVPGLIFTANPRITWGADVLCGPDELTVLVKGESSLPIPGVLLPEHVTEIIQQGWFLLALAFYRLPSGALFQVFVEAVHPHFPQSGDGADHNFIAESANDVGNESYRLRRLLVQPSLALHVLSAEEGGLRAQKTYRVPIPDPIRTRLLELLDQLEAHRDAVGGTNFHTVLAEYNAANPISASPILMRPEEVSHTRRSPEPPEPHVARFGPEEK